MSWDHRSVFISPAQQLFSQWVSGSVVEGAPTEEPRPDTSNARNQRPATRAIGVSRALACVLKYPWLPTGVLHFTLPRPSILCGCINIPGRQVKCGMGPMHYRMCDICTKKTWSLLGARRQNLSRLRVEKLGCAGSRQVIPAACHRLGLKRASSSVPGMYVGWSLRTTDMPLCCSSWTVSSLCLP
jgi:hypothetical protein